jgi:hypothetical protein
MDFGIARAQGSQRMTRDGSIVGTLAYMSPEQCRGQDVDGLTDLYSLGIVLYEMLTGKVPFEADSDYELMQQHINTPPEWPSRRVQGIPPHAERALMKALAKKPHERFASVTAFKGALGAPASRTEAVSIVHKVTRLAGTAEASLPAITAAVSNVAQTVKRSPIPFALRGILIGGTLALAVAGAALFFLAPPTPPPPVASTPPVTKVTAPAVTPAPAPSQSQNPYLIDTRRTGQAPAVQPAVDARQPPGNNPGKPAPGNRVPFEVAAEAQAQGPAANQPGGVTPTPARSAAVEDVRRPRPEPVAPPPAAPPAVQPAATQTMPAQTLAPQPPATQPAAVQPPAVRTPVPAPVVQPPAPQPPSAEPAPQRNAPETAADPAPSAPAPQQAAQAAPVQPPPAQPAPVQAAPPSDPPAPDSAAPGNPPGAAGPAPAPSAVAGGVPGNPVAQAPNPTRGVQTAVAPVEHRRPAEKDAIAAYEARSFARARELAEPCARDGNPECQFIVGRILETGSAGPKDPGMAADWYRKAAEAGLAKARFNLGALYYSGEGLPRDPRLAAEWFSKAAYQNHALAQFNLAHLYEKGEGVPRNLNEARRWYGEVAEKATDQELVEDAQAALDRLSGRRRRR